MRKLIMFLCLSLVSCSSMSRDWGPWKIVDVSEAKREWKFCQESIHGSEYHHKGMCYDTQECRYRTTIFRNEKSECRDKMLFCKWGEIECMIKYDLLDNIIIERSTR